MVSETCTTLNLSIIRLCKDPQSSLSTLYQDRKDPEDGVWKMHYSELEHNQVMQGSLIILEYLISGS